MTGKLYRCSNCDSGYFLLSPLDSHTCEVCSKGTLKIIDYWPQFKCPQCEKIYDGFALQMMGDAKEIPSGPLRCKEDKSVLVLVHEEDEDLLEVEFKEDPEAWNDVLREEFERKKREEQELEAAIMQARKEHKKSTSYRVSPSHVPLRASSKVFSPDVLYKEPQKQFSSMKISSSAELNDEALGVASSSLPVEDSVSSGIGSSETIVKAPAEVITPKFEYPVAEEFWQFFFVEENLDDPDKFPYSSFSETEEKIYSLLDEARKCLMEQLRVDISHPWVEEVSDNALVYYVGDTHGSILDTDKIIRFIVKQLEKADKEGRVLKVIFLGDYVDRNIMDIHNLLYILSFMLRYPSHVRLLRGNHEEITICSSYGFRDNVERNFSTALFEAFGDFFAYLPLVHAIDWNDKRIIALHGGIPLLVDNERINELIDEIPDIPDLFDESEFMDSGYSYIDEMDSISQQILWNDPAIDLPVSMKFTKSRRGGDFLVFGKEVFLKWMEVNHADRLIRAHELFLEGHMEYFDKRLFSIFSSSNYVNRRISAKILEFDFQKDWEKNWRHYTIMKDL